MINDTFAIINHVRYHRHMICIKIVSYARFEIFRKNWRLQNNQRNLLEETAARIVIAAFLSVNLSEVV